MTSENAENPAESGLKEIGKGLGKLFGALGVGQPKAMAPTGGGERTFVLRYNQESHTVKESDVKGDLPTVEAAFNQHAGRLGLETSRERSYRSGETVVDGSSKVEWGNTYLASVIRATKG